MNLLTYLEVKALEVKKLYCKCGIKLIHKVCAPAEKELAKRVLSEIELEEELDRMKRLAQKGNLKAFADSKRALEENYLMRFFKYDTLKKWAYDLDNIRMCIDERYRTAEFKKLEKIREDIIEAD